MINALLLAIRQLGDPGMRRYVWLSILLALLAFVVLAVVAEAAIGIFASTGHGWLDWIVKILGGAGSILLAWLLLPAATITTLGLFLDRIVERVEATHYPDLPPARPQPASEVILGALRMGGLTLLVNLLLLPLLLLPAANVPIFLAVNGYLLGREYMELVALRRMDATAATAFRKANAFLGWTGGMIIAAIFLIPIVNLAAPAVGAAFITHLFYRRWKAPLSGEGLVVARQRL